MAGGLGVATLLEAAPSSALLCLQPASAAAGAKLEPAAKAAPAPAGEARLR